MRCNLVPKERRTVWYDRLLTAYAASCMVFAVFLLSGMAAAGTVFHYWALQEQQRFTAHSFPVQQQIRRQNEREQRMRRLMEDMKKQQAGRIHYAALLVMLADTKPAAVTVSRLAVQQDHIIVSGYSQETNAERQWQEAVRRQPFVKAVRISQKKKKAETEPAFQMEVEWRDEKSLESSQS